MACGHLQSLIQSKKLILARDRFGKKPLYYMFDNGCFYFGSEIKSLNIINPNENRINYRKCSIYLGSHYRYVDSDNETFFENIKQFPKACFWDVNEKTNPKSYWNLKEIIENIDQVNKEHNWEEEFSYLLNDAVRIRLRSDVPIASLLSGGMDSTSITALALSHKSNFTSVSATFAYDQYDESQYIDSFVSMHRNNHTYIKPSAQDLLPTLEEMIQFHDEPICTSTWYSMYIMAKEISRLTKVVLTGHGGDEILGGYWDHFHLYWDTIANEHSLLSSEISKWSKNHNRSLTEIEIFKNRIKNLKKIQMKY